MPEARVIEGDMLEELPKMEAESFDSVVTDPPYHLLSVSRNGSRRINKDPAANPFSRHDRGNEASQGGFMGHAWDGGHEVAFQPDTWRAVYRVLKPGGHLLAFGGTRTSHRLACAIEDAGFEIRDTLTWLYGSGFPKSLDVARAIDKAAGMTETGEHGRIKPGHEMFVNRTDAHAGGGRAEGWDRPWKDDPEQVSASHYVYEPVTEEAQQWAGWGSALKPAFEPIILARRPLSEKTVAANVLKYGTGALNIDACRIETDSRPLRTLDPKPEANGAVYAGRREAGGGFDGGSKAVGETSQGRWPANVVLSHSDDCVRVGERQVRSSSPATVHVTAAERNGNTSAAYGAESRTEGHVTIGYGLETVPVWNCADGCPVRMLDEQSGDCSSPWIGNNNDGAKGGFMFGGAPQSIDAKPEYRDSGGASRFFYTAKSSRSERDERVRQAGARNTHPTVKPVDLMRWLCRLVTPPGGRVLDCFAGSGSTLVAALYEGFDAVGVERQPDYVRIARQRIDGAQMGFVWVGPHSETPEPVEDEEVEDEPVPQQIGLFE